MGNSTSSARESRPHHTRSRADSLRNAASVPSGSPHSNGTSSPARPAIYSMRTGRGSLLHLGGRESHSEREAPPEPRRETKQEREARKAEKERIAREKERERSMREEGVDGAFLVTLGTYTGPEDFNKAVVRQLMIERRLAPFWKGLNDHSDSWTEHQLVAAAQGLPIPAADEVPPYMERSTSQVSNNNGNASYRATTNTNSLAIPGSDSLSPASANIRPTSSSLPSASSATNLFRGRAKTLASLGASKSGTTTPTPQEMQLPPDPYVNGQRIEAYLYKDAAECPICFLYYPPYLNRTRCCDQPICSECFVQIKRPDPHPPEHHDENGNPVEANPDEEALLVSEPSACPFCVTPEFGVTYQPPPFRRGLVYAGPVSLGSNSGNPAMSSNASLNVPAPAAGRRRTTSLSANDSNVITTDRVRPDWAKKLADARSHALRRSAAATALHNAAYVLGNTQQASDSRGFTLGRRRRTIFATDSPAASGSGTPNRLPDSHPLSHLSNLILHGDRSNDDLTANRTASRRSRVQDLEELMMMEAIRLSLAAEEERKKKEDKEAKKEEKKRAKEAKKADKTAKKGGLYSVGANNSSTTWSSIARSTSNIAQPPPATPSSASPPPSSQGKGKAPVGSNNSHGFNPLSEPTSTLNTDARESSSSSNEPGAPFTSNNPSGDPQRHLETQRANLQSPSQPIAFGSPANPHNHHLRHLSNASSINSSLPDSAPDSYRHPSDFNTPNASGLHFDSNDTSGDVTPDVSGMQSANAAGGAGGPGLEPMFNFQSLAAMIGEEEKARRSNDADHVEFAETITPDELEDKNAESSSSAAAAGASASASAALPVRTPSSAAASSSSRAPPSQKAPADAKVRSCGASEKSVSSSKASDHVPLLSSEVSDGGDVDDQASATDCGAENEKEHEHTHADAVTMSRPAHETQGLDVQKQGVEHKCLVGLDVPGRIGEQQQQQQQQQGQQAQQQAPNGQISL